MCHLVKYSPLPPALGVNAEREGLLRLSCQHCDASVDADVLYSTFATLSQQSSNRASRMVCLLCAQSYVAITAYTADSSAEDSVAVRFPNALHGSAISSFAAITVLPARF